jgi:hypothetical protein
MARQDATSRTSATAHIVVDGNDAAGNISNREDAGDAAANAAGAGPS